MKKIEKKLILKKNVVSNLNQLEKIFGGATLTSGTGADVPFPVGTTAPTPNTGDLPAVPTGAPGGSCACYSVVNCTQDHLTCQNCPDSAMQCGLA